MALQRPFTFPFREDWAPSSACLRIAARACARLSRATRADSCGSPSPKLSLLKCEGVEPGPRLGPCAQLPRLAPCPRQASPGLPETVWRSQCRLLGKRGRDRGLWVGFPVLLCLWLICAGPTCGPCPITGSGLSLHYRPRCSDCQFRSAARLRDRRASSFCFRWRA
jgi:hypothetical protein